MSVDPNREKLSNGATLSATNSPYLPKTNETCRRPALVCRWRCGANGRLMMIWSEASALDATSQPEGTDAWEAGDARAELPRTHEAVSEAA